MAGGALPGFRDFYPDEFAQRAHIFRAWREVCRRYAFVEYDGPPLEPLELYTKKSGEEIVNQLYAFTDKGGREVALRPEMTPTFARMVSARANALRKPVRWYSTPQLFRYERQQKGRLKEHFQLNVDIVGETSELADAELLALAIDVMRELGLGPADVRARVSDRRLLVAALVALGVEPKDHLAVFGVIDKADRLPGNALLEKLEEIGLASSAPPKIREMIHAPDPLAAVRDLSGANPALTECLARVDRYLASLVQLGCREWVDLDLKIVRGLAYYTGIVFELFDAKGELRAICGGGRYDTLLRDLGDADLPALGFGMGDVVLAELVRERGLMPAAGGAGADLCLVGGDGARERGMGDALRLVRVLREAGWSVDHALNEERYLAQAQRNQLDGARKSGARSAVWFQSAGVVTVQSLAGKLNETPKYECEAAPLLSGSANAIAGLVQWYNATFPARTSRRTGREPNVTTNA